MHPQSRSPPGRQELKTGESPEVLWSASLEYAVMNKSDHVNNVERTRIVALSPISMCCGVCTLPHPHTQSVEKGRREEEGGDFKS